MILSLSDFGMVKGIARSGPEKQTAGTDSIQPEDEPVFDTTNLLQLSTGGTDELSSILKTHATNQHQKGPKQQTPQTSRH